MGQIYSRMAFTGMRVTATSLRISRSRSLLNGSGSLSLSHSFSLLLLRVNPCVQSSALLNLRYYFHVLCFLSFCIPSIAQERKTNRTALYIDIKFVRTQGSRFFFLERDAAN